MKVLFSAGFSVKVKFSLLVFRWFCGVKVLVLVSFLVCLGWFGD